jgi:hypothetical protein
MLLEMPDRQRGFKKERLIRTILNHPNGDLTKYRIAQLAEVSEPWTRQYTETLEDQGYLADTTVLKPQSLYEEWLNTRIQPNQIEVSLQQPMDLLADTNHEYALTTYQAENIHQGLLFTSTTDFYIKPDHIAEWLDIIEEKGMLGGGNTRLRVTDAHVFYNQQQAGDHTTVSSPQLIVDRLHEGGPCEEAAHKLIDKHHSRVR